MAKKKNTKSKAQKAVDSLLDSYNKQKAMRDELKKDKKKIKDLQRKSKVPHIYDKQIEAIEWLEDMMDQVLIPLKKAIDANAKNL